MGDKKARVTWVTVSRSVYSLGGEYDLLFFLQRDASTAPRTYALTEYEMGVQKRISPWLTLRELDAFIAGYSQGLMHDCGKHKKERVEE